MAHKATSDRLINDRRVLNDTASRLDWIKLPFGSQLTQVILRPDQIIVASGDD